MAIPDGPRDQRPTYTGDDSILSYRGAPLAEPLTLAGPVTVTVRFQSDCPDTDIIAKLIQAEPDGRATLLMDGVVRAMLREPTHGIARLQPGETVVCEVALGHIHHTIPAGHCLQLDICSSNFPRRARNTNSGNLSRASDGAADIRVATNTIHHGGEPASVVTLCVRGHVY